MAEMNEVFAGKDTSPFFCVSDAGNTLHFIVQEGPVGEHGVNGCQVDTIILVAKTIIESFNSRFPCRENSLAITKLDEALLWLGKRTADRLLRGVEGKNEV